MEHIKHQNAEYHASASEPTAEELARKYREHQEYMRKAQKDYYQRNRDKVREKARANAEALRADSEKYAAFLERKKAYNKSYYAKRKITAGGTS
jgi:CRISPR/Cas system CMR subunit Cmr6 (Cas7 group RAMP superfamily)